MKTTTINKLYYDPARPSALSTLQKLRSATAAAKKEGKPTLGAKEYSDAAIRAWLEKQDAHTYHRPVRKRFARISYTVTTVMDVCDCDLLDVQAYAKYNTNYKYILSVIIVFSKYLHMITIKTKNEPSVAPAFRSIFHDPKYLTSRGTHTSHDSRWTP